jgi:hypothetical protein
MALVYGLIVQTLEDDTCIVGNEKWPAFTDGTIAFALSVCRKTIYRAVAVGE